jgi:FlaA1/EpsC-like NDP-sugar epimerase
MKYLKNSVKKVLNTSSFFKKALLITLDIFLISISYILSVYLISESLYINNLTDYVWILYFSIFFGIPLYLVTGNYDSITRYPNNYIAYFQSIRSLVIGFSILIFSTFSAFETPKENYWILISIIITFFMCISRFLIRDFIFFINRSHPRKKKSVAIYGAGSAGTQLLSSLRFSNVINVKLVLDDNSKLWNRKLGSIKISSPEILLKEKHNIDQILLAIPSLNINRRKEIIQNLQRLDLPILQIPSIEDLASGKSKIDSFKPISIKDLLGRDSVRPNLSLLGPSINGSVICVTGAGGSIGSELCRQIIKLKPKKLIILDNNELNLYTIIEEIKNNYSIENLTSYLANICNKKQITDIFQKHNVDIIFHSAAYKHVPIVEKNVLSGLENNIIGTKVICESARSCSAKKIILISSDKAVRPSNIMGASKRCSELVVQAFAEEEKAWIGNPKTLFSMVRFGNVLASSGSVVPLFENQIKSGGPITITHPEIIRYFMTIEEAAQLVIQSSEMAKGGDVFLLDMGDPVKINDLAKSMIKLSDFTLKNEENQKGDIEIIYTGLRPGEKLFEELLIDDNALKTEHELIFRALEKSIPPNLLWPKLKIMEDAILNQNKEKALEVLSEIVPEWKKQY